MNKVNYDLFPQAYVSLSGFESFAATTPLGRLFVRFRSVPIRNVIAIFQV